MTSFEDYINYYEKQDDHRLVRILMDREKYDALAVEAVQLVVANRNISKEQYQEIQNNILSRRNKNKESRLKVTKAYELTGNRLFEFLRKINPIQLATHGLQAKLNFFATGLVLYGVFHLINYSDYFFYCFRYQLNCWDLNMTLILIPLLTILIAAFLLFRNHFMGWIMSMTLFTHYLLSSLYYWFYVIKGWWTQDKDWTYFDFGDVVLIGFVTTIFVLIFIFLYRIDVRNHLEVTHRHMLISIVAGFVTFFFLFFLL